MATHRRPIVFCGAGPGDPELITVKGKRALENADLILYAGSLVPEALLDWAGPEAETISSAGLNLEQIIQIMANAYQQGKSVVRLHTGDPSLYGAIAEQIRGLKKQAIEYTVIPGVTAAFAAAATMGLEYTLPEQTQTLILTRMAGRTPVPEKEALLSLAQHGASMAIYLSMALVDEVAGILKKTYGPKAACAVACRVSHPEEKILRTRIADLAQTAKREGINRLALILVGPAIEHCPDTPLALSKLYDKHFSHGYRKEE
ncbi:MAG: precorrin-4 C(11)-methyltransferase [Desulfobacteraceae bacterium]|nr:precorrin-4 C(11)-methyltransferase [Desulfobacteraceae bacterium]